ncbi:MAG: tRNA (adenosine(37)-N6)-threonylcarbamoyltransferase complex ATPase subunit type 1 TsaE [Thermomicrobiales bacterium]|nr:tRNA (adenosine(37)-N6)-threonylcarbamoyltransferase complex ATPase subunit type 1 TsaE [Thermomicrobiales bacterium]
MRDFGAELGRLLDPGDVLLLHGDLGAGKTTLSQGIARGLGIEQAVTSPTFTLVAEYRVEPPVNGIERLAHLDLYRLTDPAELDSFGFEEYLTPEAGVTLIEWPERAANQLPAEAILIEITPDGADQRRIAIRQLGAATT